SQTWLSATSSTWSNPANWTSIPVSGAATSLMFPSTAAQTYTATNDLPGAFSLGSLTFNGSSTGSVTVATGSFSSLRFANANSVLSNTGVGQAFLSGAVSIAPASTLTINVGSTTANSTTIAAAVSGTLVIASPASLGGAPTINLNGGSLSRISFGGGTSPTTINTPMVVGATGGALGAYNTITQTQLNYAGNITGSGSLTILGP